MNQEIRKAALRDAMQQARARTLRLLDCVSDDFLKVRVHDFYSPIGWHFGHIGMTEEYWVCEEALRHVCRDEGLRFLFTNIPDNPKDNRVHLPSRQEIIAYLAATRENTLQALETTNLDSPNELIADGYAWEFALQHECQHQETIAEMLQLIQKEMGAHSQSADTAGREIWKTPRETEMMAVPGGSFVMGSNHRHGYDNEKTEHQVEVAPFRLDKTPVTAGQWQVFRTDGGYRRRELWSEAGWNWKEAENADRPEYWLMEEKVSGAPRYYSPFGVRVLDADEPVSSVSWFEADAYARWAGKRLPTEAEWEYAAAYDAATGQTRAFSWGDTLPEPRHASFGLSDWKPALVGARPDGMSAFGLLDMTGGVWEWTASPFLPYPGFRAFPYDGYSKDHMDGTHFVCRGGSWATSGIILRCSFRNWYVPTYRQGFLGLRCAR